MTSAGSRVMIVLTFAGLLALFGVLGYVFVSAGDAQPGTPVERNTGVYIDTSDDYGLHVREVTINGKTCVVATAYEGVGIDCLETNE